jgi:Fe-S-cluster containining protein
LNFPCASCKAECCGPVPLSQSRLDTITAYLRSLPAEEYDALASQTRGPLNCSFVDKRNHTCSVYAVRPALCRLYGRTEGLLCHKIDAPSLAQLVSKSTAWMETDLDGEPVTLSNGFKW